MLTVGHELGHAVTMPLMSDLDEEAKAFAFQIAFMRTLHKNNIANLASSINLDFNPATNGVHDIAFNHVAELVAKGNNPLELFKSIAQKEFRVDK